jgi:hypothetical protein
MANNGSYKMLKQLMLASALTLAVIGTAQAYQIRGAGAGSCGAWLESRRNYRPDFAMNNWVLGYLSGAMLASHRDIFKELDNDAIFFWLDNYCRTRPTTSLSDGLDDLAVVGKARQ